jgi:hypothetical protein
LSKRTKKKDKNLRKWRVFIKIDIIWNYVLCQLHTFDTYGQIMLVAVQFSRNFLSPYSLLIIHFSFDLDLFQFICSEFAKSFHSSTPTLCRKNF